MSLTREELKKLLGLVDITGAEEIDCTEFLHRVAGYVERLAPDGTPPAGYEDVALHLRVCPECCEEFEALCRALREEGGAA